jgi:hypothetical protein
MREKRTPRLIPPEPILLAQLRTRPWTVNELEGLWQQLHRRRRLSLTLDATIRAKLHEVLDRG